MTQDFELEEFQALESQIQAQQSQHGGQRASQPAGKPPLAASLPGRSYAVQHQKQQQQGSYDHLAAWATQALQPPVRGGMQGYDADAADELDDAYEAGAELGAQSQDSWQDDVSFAPSNRGGGGAAYSRGGPLPGHSVRAGQGLPSRQAAAGGRAVASTLDAWREEPAAAHGDLEQDQTEYEEEVGGASTLHPPHSC